MSSRLYLVELTVADWPASVEWYRSVLGWTLTLRDDAHQFALLESAGGRLALKAGQPLPGTTLLSFEVDDLPAELDRLAGLGVVVQSPPRSSPEGYRRAIVCDPDGHRLCLFDWIGKRVV